MWLRTMEIMKEETCCCQSKATISDLQHGIVYMHHAIDRIVHTTTSATPVGEHWLE